MRKSELVALVAETTGVEKETVESVLEKTLVVIKRSVTAGEPIYMRGFGSFILKDRAAKPARNIKAGTTVMIPASKKPAFKPSKQFLTTK